MEVQHILASRDVFGWISRNAAEGMIDTWS
jgi:hypothetical protein